MRGTLLHILNSLDPTMLLAGDGVTASAFDRANDEARRSNPDRSLYATDALMPGGRILVTKIDPSGEREPEPVLAAEQFVQRGEMDTVSPTKPTATVAMVLYETIGNRAPRQATQAAIPSNPSVFYEQQ